MLFRLTRFHGLHYRTQMAQPSGTRQLGSQEGELIQAGKTFENSLTLMVRFCPETFPIGLGAGMAMIALFCCEEEDNATGSILDESLPFTKLISGALF